jgi:hypothetical protein
MFSLFFIKKKKEKKLGEMRQIFYFLFFIAFHIFHVFLPDISVHCALFEYAYI